MGLIKLRGELWLVLGSFFFFVVEYSIVSIFLGVGELEGVLVEGEVRSLFSVYVFYGFFW